MPNTQLPMALDRGDRNELLVVDRPFATVQGEGPFAGRPAAFVRLAGCNLQCPSCDTEYTLGAARRSIDDLVEDVAALGVPPSGGGRHSLVVITGGEPFRQPIGELVRSLLYADFFVQIETNGSVFLEDFPWASSTVKAVVSPKTPKVADGFAAHAPYWKYPLKAGHVDPTDGLPLYCLGESSGPRPARPGPKLRPVVFVTPVDEGDAARNAANLAAAVESCRKFGHTLNLQLHKVIGLP